MPSFHSKRKASLCNKEEFTVPTEMYAAGVWNEEEDADPRGRGDCEPMGWGALEDSRSQRADRGSGF